MNEATVTQTKEFVFLRLSEPFPFSDDKTTPFYLAAMVGGVLLLFALLSFVLPLVRTMRGVLSGLAVRGAAWVALASAGVVGWLAMTNATDPSDTGLRGQLFWAHLGGQVLLALLFGVSGLMTLLGGDRHGKGGNTEGVLFGALLTTLFGRADTSRFSWWHLFTAGGRALLYLIPLACLGISRGFETDPEPVWWLFTGGMLATACNLTTLMYVKDSGAARFLGWFLILNPVLSIAAVVFAGLGVGLTPLGWLTGLIITAVGLVVPLVLLGIGGLLWMVKVFRREEVGGWAKVSPAAFLRCTALAALAFCFLLPAMQPWETAEKRSRVVVLLDVSPSMTRWSDDISRDPNAKLKTRMDKVLDFLTSADGEFTAKLLEKNPVVVYRLGASLDPEPGVIRRGPDDSPAKLAWTRDEWASFVQYDFKAWVLGYEGPDGKGFGDDAKQALQAAAAWGAGPGDAEWVLTWAKADDATSGADRFAEDDKDAPDVRLRKATDRKLLAGVREKAAKRVDMARIIAQGSAVPDAVTSAINREQSNMTQAVIVFSDGRSNMSSDAAVPDLTRRAKEANIPVYTVSVGSAREVVSIVISDLQAPDRTQPDEPTQVTVAVDGIGFKQNDTVEATLELFLPGKDPKNNDTADHEMKQTVTFGPGETPHGEVTFVLDAEEFAKLGAASLIEEISPPKPGRKWQLKKGQWKVRAKVPVDAREIFREPNHLSPVRGMEVMEKPLRVLMVANAPSREFQILRTLLVREAEQKRAELCIFVQNEGGTKGTIVQDVPPGRLLLKFPDELDVSKDTSVGQGGEPGSDAETLRQRAKYNNLNEYDLIICFDPNWKEQDDGGQFRIPNSAFQKLKTWSQNYGGGLIYVAGPFYTAQLMRSDGEGGRLKPLLDMLPVEPDDLVASDDPLLKINGRKTARRLKFNPPKDSDVLRLDDLTPQRDEALKAVAGWELFFTGQETPPKKTEEKYLKPDRGFFTYYPVKKVKPLAASLAEFVNVDEKGQEALRPFYAVGPSGAGRTAWIGSGEIFRLRAVPDVGIQFYDKFWLQVARYCSAKRTTGAKARGDVLMSKEVIAGTPIRVRTRVLQSSGEPYTENELDKPKVTIEQLDQNGNVTDKMGPFDVLKPAKLGTKFEGYYQGVITPDPAKMKVDGFRYRVNVTKADLPEPLTAEFILKSANPELDNTKPDLAALREMASPVKAVLDVEPDATRRTALAARLGLADDDVKSGKAKLAFALDDPARLKVIPDLVRSRSESPQNRGIVDPLWDDSFDPAEDKVTAWLRGVYAPELEQANPFRAELIRFNAGSSSAVVRAWMPVVLVQLILLALTFVLRAAADKPRMSTLVLVLASLIGFLTLTPVFLLGVILPVVAMVFPRARGPVVTGMLGLSAVVQMLAAETVVCFGTGLIIGLWLPVTLFLQLALALTWVLRTRVDLPKTGVLGFLEGALSAVIGLVFIPVGLAACLPPLVGLYGQVLGDMPPLAQVILYASTLLPGVALAATYALAGRYRGAVGSIVLTLAMLSQALAAALAVWYGNPFPIGYAVLALAALLCSEWTIRKLIRLA
jgi:hypothetical protein